MISNRARSTSEIGWIGTSEVAEATLMISYGPAPYSVHDIHFPVIVHIKQKNMYNVNDVFLFDCGYVKWLCHVAKLTYAIPGMKLQHIVVRRCLVCQARRSSRAFVLLYRYI